jgi:hypothetical protein
MYIRTFNGTFVNLETTVKLQVVDLGYIWTKRGHARNSAEEIPAAPKGYILEASLAGGTKESIWWSADEEECYRLMEQIECAIDGSGVTGVIDCGLELCCDDVPTRGFRR